MGKLCCFALLFIIIQVVQAAPQPQFFGQSFSSSSFVGPNGQVITSSVYEDTQGNRLINGQNAPISSAPAAPVKPAPQPAVTRPATSAGANKVNSGQYVHDDSGKWKGN